MNNSFLLLHSPSLVTKNKLFITSKLVYWLSHFSVFVPKAVSRRKESKATFSVLINLVFPFHVAFHILPK